jgi:hypothetical protein
MIETSVKNCTRAIVICMILSAVGGWFGEMYVPSFMGTGDPATTAAQLRLNDGLFRLGFAAYLVEAFCDILLAWLFYVLLRPVHRELALLSAFLGIVSMSLFATTKLLYFLAPTFLSGSNYLAAFTPDQLNGLAGLFLLQYGILSNITFFFYGAGWIVRGYLTIRSTYLPRLLGALMIAGGLGFVAKTITYVLAPAYSPLYLVAPMFLNLVGVVGWLLVKGVDSEKWERALARAAERNPLSQG